MADLKELIDYVSDRFAKGDENQIQVNDSLRDRSGEGLSKGMLLHRLTNLAKWTDHEAAHIEADMQLLKFIHDKEIAEAYNAIERWHA